MKWSGGILLIYNKNLELRYQTSQCMITTKIFIFRDAQTDYCMFLLMEEVSVS